MSRRSLFARGLLVFAAVLAVLGSAAPAQAQKQRLVWSYDGGFFEDEGNRNWVEKNASGSFYFKESSRNSDYVELSDKGRACTVRLYNTSMWLKGINGKYQDFTKFYNGHWSK